MGRSMLGTTRSWGVRGAALLLLAALNAMVGPTLLGGPSPANAADPCGAGGNKIACENDKLGTDPDIWEIDGAGDPEIQGFATDISVNVGQRIDFKIDTEASSYTIDIYRMGYYRGLGARKITSVTPSARLPQRQPACITDVQTDLYDCGNWGVSASWNVPSTAVSGVYIAHIKRSTGDGSHITFIVRDDSSTSAILFQTADPTWQAYNTYGGAYFYGGGSHGRAYKVSYNRPVLTRGREHGRDFFMSAEYAMVRFMERNGYDVSYFSGVDTDRRGALLKNHKVFLSVGHDEYWSKAQRANIEAARDAGVNLQFLSGNDGYWKTRYQPSIDGSSTSYRTLTSYKETWSNDKVDPDPEWTGTWRDPRFAPQSRGAGVPENALIGTQYQVNFSDLAMTVSAAEGKYRLWRNTSIANLSSGMATLAPHTVGYESNEDVDNGFRPAGLVRLSTTTGSVPEYLTDFGNTVVPGTTRHNMTMYKAPSGALVFSAGTVQWSWGLDAVHDSAYAQEPADVRMQQAQVNLFADMGAQPTTLMSGLASASKSTDVTAPTVSISTPAAGATTPNGQNVTITGTASDVGGRVAGVEVSTDGGNSWSAATGTTSWTYTFRQKGLGSSQVRVRAMDDSANIGTAATRAFDAQCPCSIFGGETPKIAAANDPHAVELGVRFVPLTDGFVTGVRFFKGTGNTGTHVGSLWSSSGERLAQATFGTESATGWQTVTFQTPVAVAAGKSYVASYTAPNGNYALESWGFAARPRETAALMVDGGYGAPAGGVFANPGQFPDQSHQNANYYVDVTFTTTDSSALIALNQSPVPGSSSVPSSTKISAKFSKPLAAGTAGLTLKDANGATVAGTTAYDAATRTVTFTPDAPLAGFVKFTAKATGTDTSGNPVTTGDTWSFTTVKPPNPPGVCPCTLFDDSLTPTLLEDSDRDPVTLGVRFTPDVNGQVTGVRFYKGANNTGSHTGTLWAADGTVLATGTFSDESTSGWQTLTFATPVQVRKGTTYTASYRTTVGRYSATPNAFAAANLSRSPLLVTSAAGAYTYGTGFPSASSSTSYLVDVVFEKVAPAIAVTGQDPAPGAVQVARGTKVKVGFTAGIAPSGWTMTVTSNGSTLPGSAALDATGTQLLWTPASQLPADAAVDVSLTGVVSTDGAALAPQTWTFHTRSADSLTQQSLFGDEVPAVEAASDGAPVELGVAWTPSRNGTVTAIRFYKGTGNTGTHTGSLWSADGTRLAQATFVAETATGWQTAQLSTPIEVQAGTSYVVSYFAPAGHYAYTQDFFNGPWTAGDLTAPAANNGRYLYAAGGGFPSFSWGAANYFVDVVFEREAASIAVDSRTPVDGATDVPVAVKPSITLTAPLATGWTMTLSRGGDAVSGQAALSGGGSTVTFTPAAALATDTVYTATLSGATSTEGAPLPTQTWTFRTAAPNTASLLEGEVPASASINDPDAVELGMAFVPSQDGTVTGIRFYKGTGNTGTHTGSVWDASGNRLGQLTFANETATGWQSASFTTPVTVTAGQTYVVSYLAPNGRYSATPQYFAAPRTVGPLTAPANTNGRFRYGASGGFPNESWNATNYFVDVVFRASQ